MVCDLAERNLGPGEMGQGVTFPESLQEEVKKKFKINQFNLMASDKIALNRSLRDVRIPGFVLQIFFFYDPCRSNWKL